MNRRSLSTLLLLVGALGLGAYIYFVESERKPASDTTEEKAKVFANVDAAKIQELGVKAGDRQTTIKKDNGVWMIVAPVSARADENELSGITSNLSTLEVQRVVDEKPGDLAQFGLAPPKIEITFRTEGDGAARTLHIGDKTATGGDLYAKADNDPKVFLIPGFVDTTFNRSTFDLREKSVLKFDRDKVSSVEVVTSDRTLTLSKQGDAWMITSPIKARADIPTVEGSIAQIATGQMKDLVADSATDLKPYGLEKPVTQITFAEGSARSTLQFGTSAPDGSLYAKDASRPLIFTVEAGMILELTKPPDEFRPKDIYGFRSFTGNHFEITRGGTTTTFEKQKGKDESAPETWVQVQPKPDKPVDQTKIEDFLSKMANLRAQSFVDALPAGATEVARTTDRWSEGRNQESVTFHRSGADMFAVRGSEPGASKFTAGDFDAAITALEAIK